MGADGRFRTARGQVSAAQRDALPGRDRRWPLPAALAHLSGLVAEFAGRSGKPVSLAMNVPPGILVSSAVVDAIMPVLVQLLRNAVNHGIEPSIFRVAGGKPLVGRVSLDIRLGQHAIGFAVKDDGRGIDPEEIAVIAVASGLVGLEEVARLRPAGMQALIFRPGFTTVTGPAAALHHGNGLALGEARLAPLGGGLTLQSRPGKGATFTAFVPRDLGVDVRADEGASSHAA
ncbi:MAG: hypothetical protein KIS96_13785 [Bauldia sp.]|nr:hypothetical protein [Bauldia sp.]